MSTALLQHQNVAVRYLITAQPWAECGSSFIFSFDFVEALGSKGTFKRYHTEKNFALAMECTDVAVFTFVT